jgi:catechol 2,3-dioxygenase-like lactoylglutathione lyase family enzyme
MEKVKAIIKNASPYMQDKMNLPVKDVDTAIPFYETIMGFHVASKKDEPYKFVALERDGIQMGLAENGGDPTQEGCFFEVDDVAKAFAELKSNGFQKESPDFRIDTHGATKWKVFFVVAPDGLCYCYGERQS